MITERTLKKWRKEALTEEDVAYAKQDGQLMIIAYKELQSRILRMTQELMDSYLIRRA